MASDGPTPPPCEPYIKEYGTVVLITASVPPNATERWVKKVAERSGQLVDWGFVGGRIVVSAVGDLDKVIETMQELKMEWAYTYRANLAESPKHGDFDPASVPWMERWPPQD